MQPTNESWSGPGGDGGEEKIGAGEVDEQVALSPIQDDVVCPEAPRLNNDLALPAIDFEDPNSIAPDEYMGDLDSNLTPSPEINTNRHLDNALGLAPLEGIEHLPQLPAPAVRNDEDDDNTTVGALIDEWIGGWQALLRPVLLAIPLLWVIFELVKLLLGASFRRYSLR